MEHEGRSRWLAGMAIDAPAADVLERRAGIVSLSQSAHDAVLTPAEPGGLSHAQRAALACRMARMNGDEALTAHYRSMLNEADAARGLEAMCDPGAVDGGQDDPRLAAIVRHIDMLTGEPKRATRQHIEDLKAAGVEGADIVRLSELAAFVNYQVRVVAGLRLLGAKA